LNGSFVVYRKLQQDVAGFWQFLEREAARLFEREDAERMIWLAARLVGRWPSGAPLVLAPHGDDRQLGNRDDFLYRDDGGGLSCPIGAHIRRANPRDDIMSALVHVHEEIPVLTSPVGSGYEKFAQIKDEHHAVRAQTANLAAGPPLETDPEREVQGLKGQVSFADMRRAGEVYRGIYYPAHDAAGGPLVTVVAIPSRPLQRGWRPSAVITTPASSSKTESGVLYLRSLPRCLPASSALGAWAASGTSAVML
jgi:hypothetical protein